MFLFALLQEKLFMELNMIKYCFFLVIFLFLSKGKGLSFRYIGCYEIFSKGLLTNSVVNSANECWNYCNNLKLAFAAIKNISECYCGNTTDYTVPSFNCNLMCSDNIDTCGGIYFYSVYLAQNFVQPNYIGCYRDSQVRDMSSEYHGFGTMTNDWCFNYCSNLNYTYMATQCNYACFCDNQYGRYGPLEMANCNTKCDGNTSQTCGGPFANSVYTACYSFALNKTCSQMYHCDASVVDVNGRCPTNKCINGWKGKSCNQRDCRVQNGSCDHYQRECKEFVFGNEILSECVCKEGYESTSLTISDDKNCKDIDECKLGMCNLSLSNCTNTIGSYKCTCKKGFVNSSPTTCEDLDECETTLNNCDVKTASCYNFPSSYNCSCKDGYTRKDNFTCNVASLLQTGTIVGVVMGSLLAIALGFLIIFMMRRYFHKSKTSSLTTDAVTIQPQTNNENKMYNDLEISQTDKHFYSNLTTDKGHKLYNSLQISKIDENKYKTLYSPTE